jgi:hypothetical protein
MQAGLVGSMSQSISQFDYSSPRPSSFRPGNDLRTRFLLGHFDFFNFGFSSYALTRIFQGHREHRGHRELSNFY